MKTAWLALLLLFQLAPSFASAAFYQWTDAMGVVHLTDDPDKIPKSFQKRAKRLDLPESRKPAGAAAPAPQPEPLATAPKPLTPGGHDETWWRSRIGRLRGELKALQDARLQKEEKLVELRRQRTLFHKASDREAINAMQAELSADDARVGDLLNRIGALELEAARAGVPAEWLR